MQVTVVPRDLAPIEVDTSGWPGLTGEYRLSEKATSGYHVWLRDGALFKFEVQGYVGLKSKSDDTWLGVPFSDGQVVEMAERCGFEARHRIGAGTEQFWLWFFKRPIAI